MNGWNSKEVHELYPSQALGALTKRKDGRVNVERPEVAMILRQMAASGNGDPDDAETRDAAIKEANNKKGGFRMPYTKPIFGLAAGWVSEVAPPATLDGMLKHADAYLNPLWNKGGLYYPRQDEAEDAEGNWLFTDPVTGNAAIGYARLNVPDGQKIMWNDAWTPEHVQCSVALENVSFSEGVDFLRCRWVKEAENGFSGLVLTMRTWDGKTSNIHPHITALPSGRYEVYVDGSLTRTHVQDGVEALQLEIIVDGAEMDVCILQR